ncbi:Uncharacterised protein [Listeria fleischmannii subsp. fleischmannii]|uniref:Uncharacterized protein n=1 Tax=Listeria fleischmannii subsp. fleischmannii TaxID=1671902 RepID=A0A2X3JDA5_9LIST|nr:Uncharacterised protein [Listeria fleischmannii subsp. fleischmannii]
MDTVLRLIIDLEFIGIIIMCIIIINFKKNNFFTKTIQGLLLLSLIAVTSITMFF